MFESKTELIQHLNSPMNIAALALDEIQSRLEGNRIIADPSSPFCHLLEFGSSINAYVIQAVEEKFPLLYPQRAQTMEDLYLHMSDYDYLRMFGTPASTTLRMAFPKKYLIENALEYNANYKQVTIPGDTVFMIGKYPFGIYYPINILINNYTNTFTVVYDTTSSNPLHTLTKNIVDKYDMTYNSLDYLIIDVPIYQFSKSTVEETVVDAVGFIKKYTFNNNFYAIRMFNYKGGTYTEMGQSLNKLVYDLNKPTVLLQVMQDEHKLKLTIPQVYFDEGSIGSKILLEVYTTMGPLDIDTTNVDSASSIRANFGLRSRNTTKYSYILKNLPFDMVMTLNGNRISGGSSAIDFETLRKRVVYDNLVQSVPITEQDIEVYLNDSGFYVKKYIDNVTDRIYYAYRILKDDEGSIIPSTTLYMRMLSSYADDANYTGFIKQNDGSIVSLPTVLYKYVEENDNAVPLTVEELKDLDSMNKAELADALNNTQYLRTPFHIRYDLGSYPHAYSYNLMNPSVEKVIFVSENYDISSKMMSYAAVVSHLNDGVGGYDVFLSVSKSDDLKNVSEDDIVIYVLTKTTEGYWIGLTAEYVEPVDTWYKYKFHIDTNYHLTENDEISITNFQNSSYTLSEHSVPLTSDYYIVYMIRKSIIEGADITDAAQTVCEGVPDSYLTNFVALTRQYITISLGHSLSDVVKNNMEVGASGKQYAVWDHDVVATYPHDIYERKDTGELVWSVTDDEKLQLNKVASAGDVMLDEYGNTVYEHKKGDVRYSANGEPIIDKDSVKIFYTEMMFIDAKVFASERVAEMSFALSLPYTLEKYFATIRSVQDQLLERTNLYFHCVRTAGTGSFNMGNGVVSKQNIEMAFKIRCYVQSYVKNDAATQNIITDAICTAIEENIQTKNISMMTIFSQVQEKLSDYIEYFTLLGINDDVTVQTFVIQDEDAQPSLRRQLVLTDDNVLSLEKSLDIDFIALEDNIDRKVAYDTGSGA